MGESSSSTDNSSDASGSSGGNSDGTGGNGDGMGGTGGVAAPVVDSTTGMVEPITTLANLVDSLDGRIIYMPCSDTPTTGDCAGDGWYTNDGARNSCSDGVLEANLYHDIGGTYGQEYLVRFHLYGIAEPRFYGDDVTRDAGTGRPDLDGGEPTSWAEAPGDHQYPSSNYNSYELRVEDENGQEVAAYYLNADTEEGFYSILIDYEETIPIIGGGRIHFRVFDDNCRQIKNCGSEEGYPCADKAREVDVSSADPPPPQHFEQPSLGKDDDNRGQWLLIDAVEVVQ